MPEPLTTSLVLEELNRLHVAFPQNVGMRTNPAGTADVYRNGLRGLSGDAVRAAADRAIQDGEFFPKVATLRDLATSWMRHNQPTHDVAITNELYCGRCQTNATVERRWRPKVNARGSRILAPNRLHFLLEPYERVLCRCAPLCAYCPIDELEPPQMEIT